MSKPSAPKLREATLRLGSQRIQLELGDFDVHYFRDLAQDTTAMAISMGDLGSGAPLFARVHSSCATSECLMGRDCDCVEQFEGALRLVAQVGRGVVFYLLQEGRGAGLTAKARDRMIVQASENRLTTFEAYASMGLPADLREYTVLASMCRLLEIRAPLRLLTNNPEKRAAVAAALLSEKIEIMDTIRVLGERSDFNRDYLDAKQASGHALAPPSRIAGALPPGRVEVFEPELLPGDSSRVLTASYFLPVSLPNEIAWFRTSVLYDRTTERESVVLSRLDGPRGSEARESLAFWLAEEPQAVTMNLLDRIPRSDSPGRAALTRALTALRRSDGASDPHAVWVRFDERDHADR